MSLTTKIIEKIKDNEDELIINFIADNTDLCEEYKIPKKKIKEVFEFYNEYKDIIDEIILAKIRDEWVDVRNRLPSENKSDKYKEYYITIFNEYTKSIYVDEAYYIDNKWKSIMGECDDECKIKNWENIIAWKIKNIPKPYKRSEQNE